MPSFNPPPSDGNPHLEGFTVRTLDELLDHSYYRHRLEQRANELFWKRVFAWRASVSLALAAIAGALTWVGLELKTIGKKIFDEQATAIRKDADEQIAALKASRKDLDNDRETARKRASELDLKAVELDGKIQRINADLDRSTRESEELKKASTDALTAATQARQVAKEATAVVQSGATKVAELDRQIAQFNHDADLLRNIRRLNEEARSVRLFRMILLHSNDTQAFDFAVPIENSTETRPMSVTFKTAKVKSDNFAELSWEVREAGRVVFATAATLFPGKDVAVDELGALTVRVEAIRKQPFARSFLILTIRARAPEEPKAAAPTLAKAPASL